MKLALVPHVIASVAGAYQVAVADLGGDARPDVVVVAEVPSRLAWFEAPSWREHVADVPGERFIDVAPGDDRAELAVASEFDVHDARRGRVRWLRRTDEAWTELASAPEAASHRLRWADLDGDGTRELVDAAYAGATGPARLTRFRSPGVAELVDGTLHVVHALRVVRWGVRRDALLTASEEGVTLHALGNRGWRHRRLVDHAAGEVAVGQLGRQRFVATIEPAHGSSLVVYLAEGARWARHVLASDLVPGHALGTGDLDGDGRDEIVAGGKGRPDGLQVWSSSGGAWTRTWVDEGGIAPSGLVVVDLDRDGRLDVVAAGQATGNVKWYRNEPEATR